MLNITIINGPNLNLLGKREPGMYGNESFDDCLLQLKEAFPQVNFTYFQSNVEGEIVSAIQQYGFNQDGMILNPAAYTHTSIAIGDAVAAIKTPVIEVHISNVHAREDFRKISHVSAKSVGSIVGLGLKGYALATEWFIAKAGAIQ
ncbi:MAG: type II 3-dehydroquinate dehydratase [Chitinophagaceae bacterium]|jgi:3-dehydroquinate dehydratase-2|nr:type II 3-dehydroquinate dehydratase [Chitinophagaceae bacterium]